MMTSATQTISPVRPDERRLALAVAALLGLGLVFLAGFSPAAALHNAAHDFRHTANYPCH